MFPILRPFLAPREWPPARGTDFLRQIGFRTHLRHVVPSVVCAPDLLVRSPNGRPYLGEFARATSGPTCFGRRSPITPTCPDQFSFPQRPAPGLSRRTMLYNGPPGTALLL